MNVYKALISRLSASSDKFCEQTLFNNLSPFLSINDTFPALTLRFRSDC